MKQMSLTNLILTGGVLPVETMLPITESHTAKLRLCVLVGVHSCPTILPVDRECFHSNPVCVCACSCLHVCVCLTVCALFMCTATLFVCVCVSSFFH